MAWYLVKHRDVIFTTDSNIAYVQRGPSEQKRIRTPSLRWNYFITMTAFCCSAKGISGATVLPCFPPMERLVPSPLHNWSSKIFFRTLGGTDWGCNPPLAPMRCVLQSVINAVGDRHYFLAVCTQVQQKAKQETEWNVPSKLNAAGSVGRWTSFHSYWNWMHGT
jgi:hypothetical protein